MSNCFLRGSVIRYIHLSKLDVDEDLLLSISFDVNLVVFLDYERSDCILDRLFVMKMLVYCQLFPNLWRANVERSIHP